MYPVMLQASVGGIGTVSKPNSVLSWLAEDSVHPCKLVRGTKASFYFVRCNSDGFPCSGIHDFGIIMPGCIAQNSQWMFWGSTSIRGPQILGVKMTIKY